MRPMVRDLVIAAVATLSLGVSGCSMTEDPKIASSKPYNEADVTFATDMIPHHAQALQMVDLTLGRELEPDIEAFAEGIRMAQTPQIEQMVDLLQKWDDQPVPATGRDHANADGDAGGHVNSDLPGMVSDQDMRVVEAATGARFRKLWVGLMIEHHQGAMAMAADEKDNGEDKTARALAGEILETQRAEVKRMQTLLQR